MKKLKSIIILLACFIANPTIAGIGTESTLEQINNSVAFGVSIFNLDYKEIFLPSDVLNNTMPKSTEAGTGWGYFLDVRKSFFEERIYTDTYLDYYNESLKYDGSEKEEYEPDKYRYVSSVGKFRHKFFNAKAKLGYIFDFTDYNTFQIIPYVGAGYRYWYRQNNNLCVQEKYHHGKVLAGLKINWLLTDNLALSPYAEVGKLFGSKMKFCGDCDLRNIRERTGLKYTLGNKPIYEGGLELNYKIFDEFFLNTFVSYTQFKYGRSAVHQPSNTLEPESKTREIKVGIGIRYSWVVK